MVTPIYPSAFFSWGPDRVDELDVDFANDVNAPAAEVISVETTLGVNPQIEKNPIGGGNPIVYDTVDDRISAMQQGILPYISLTFDEFQVPNFFQPNGGIGIGTNYGYLNSYNIATDPFDMYNGNDITAPVTGWYIITINQDWDYWTTGYHRCSFWLDGNFFCDHMWRWDFAGNFPGGWWWPDYLINPQPRMGHNNVTWQGILTEGTRMSVYSENGCPDTPHRVSNGSFKAVCTQKLPVDAPFG